MIEEIARNVARFCRRKDVAWEEIVELGVLDAEPELMATAMIELGRANFPGPLVASTTAVPLIDEVAVVAISDATKQNPRLWPWAQKATRFIEIGADRAFEVKPVGAVEPVDTLGGEPWGRVLVERVADLGDAAAALARGDVARAAYLYGAGLFLVDAAAEHARTRKQFGRALGSFQAVSHALADCFVALMASRALTMRATREHALAAGARRSAERAALKAIHTTPQVFGGLGMMIDGPVYPVARHIRQLVSTPPAIQQGALWKSSTIR